MRILFFLSFLLLPLSLFSQQKALNMLGFDSEYNSSDSIKKPKIEAEIDNSKGELIPGMTGFTTFKSLKGNK